MKMSIRNGGVLLTVSLILGLGGCGDDGAATDEGSTGERSARVVWNGEELPVTRVSCGGISQVYAFATISDDEHYDFHFGTEDGRPRAQLQVGEEEYYARSSDELEAVEYERDVRARGTVTLSADNDAARQSLPDGGEVEFDVIC